MDSSENVSDVVVVGAGVLGAAVGYFLAKAGLKVQVLDKQGIGSGCSFHGHGSLSTMLGYVTPGPYYQLLSEAEDFLRALSPPLADETGITNFCQSLDCLHIAFNEEEAQQLQARATWQQHQGAAVQWLDEPEARAIEPRLGPRMVGAALEQSVLQIDGYRLTLALGQGAETHGASVRVREARGIQAKGGRITAVKVPGGEISCGALVIAMGAWSSQASQWLNFPIPVRPLKGQVLRLQYDGPPVQYMIFPCSIERSLAPIVPSPDGLLQVGASYEEVFDDRPTEEIKLRIMAGALDLMPALEEAQIVHHLAGPRPLSPDNLPIFGQVPGWENAYLATGHGRKGIHLSALTGQLVADLITGREASPSVDFAAFAPDRF